MRKILTLAIILLLIQSCKLKNGPGLQVNGTLQDTTFTLLYLEEVPMETNQPTIVDSVRPDQSGQFTLQAPAAEDRVYFIRPARQSYPLFAVINDSKQIDVKVKFERIDGQLSPAYTVKGSTASEQIHDFSADLNEDLRAIIKDRMALDTLLQKNKPDSIINPIRKKMIDRTKSLSILVDSQLSLAATPSAYMFILGTYQSAASNPIFSLELFSMERIKEGLVKLGGKFPNHTGLATFRRKLEEEIQKSKGLLGQSAPDFTLPDVNGKPIALKSFRGKWVLVDFWASWCRPCRMENPTVVAAYQQFKNKNFTILGVSLDREDGKQDWLKAIQDDKLVWPQVSDLKFWNSLVVPMYQIEGIPYNVLIDPQGKVVAENLRGPQLAKKLKELIN
ncbi:MAG: AhpC/TSA family protein [Bacteroidetes bacterium]|nr:AhpC/TSA family protein [Bacteroidota bacterium]